jgi:hypothetical protein
MDWVGDIDHSVTHTRRVLSLRPYYVLLLDGYGLHTIDSHFDVASPSVRTDPNTKAAFSENKDGVQIGLYPLERDSLKVQVIQGTHGAPDIQWNVPTVQFQKRQVIPAIFGTFLYPYKGNEPKFSAIPLSIQGAGVWGQSIQTEKEDAEVAIVKDGKSASFSVQSSLMGQIDVTSGGLLVRRPTGRQGALIGGWNLSSYKSTGLQFVTDVSANLLIARHDGHFVLFNCGESTIQIKLQQPFAKLISLLPFKPVELGSKDFYNIEDRGLFDMPEDIQAVNRQ